jgi:hypothetical protein
LEQLAMQLVDRAKVMAKAFCADFQRIAHRLLPTPVG